MRGATRLRMAAAGSSSGAPHVDFTTTGSTFSPQIELAVGSAASVTWTVVETGATETGLTPTINFGSVGTRTVRLTATGGGGLTDITTVNLGYDSSVDVGDNVMGAQYDKAPEACSAISGLTELTGLIRFAAAETNLGGALDLTGLASLEYVELFGADISSIVLTGCASMIRLVPEACQLTAIDLNPVAATLREFRAAIQQGGALTLTALTAPMTDLYHFCVRDQDVTGMPTAAQLPHVKELWIWNTGFTGALTADSDQLGSVMAYSNTGLTSLDLTDQIAPGAGGVLWMQDCTSLASVTIAGCDGLGNIDLSGCSSLDGADVDGILAEVASWGTSSGTLDLGSTAAPSASGAADYLGLAGRGWTVTLDSAGTGVFVDAFTRANTSGGLAEVGNGWAGTTGVVANIVGNALVNQSAGGAFRRITNPAQGLLPADYSVTITVPHAVLTGQTWWGVVGRVNTVDGTGVRLLFTSNSTTFTVGNSTGPFDGNVSVTTDAGFPASWSQDQVHTVRLTMTGSTINIFLDGQATRGFTATSTVNQALAGSSYGICGDNTMAVLDIATTVQ